jgi:hypothetical protein
MNLSNNDSLVPLGKPDYGRAAFESAPLPMLIVDPDVRLLEFNAAAAALIGEQAAKALGRRSGDVLQCLHRKDVDEGCGRGPFCKDCLLRHSVRRALDGRRVHRARAQMELTARGSGKPIDLLITCSPLETGNGPGALVILEDITEVLLLKSLLPICASCKKIRDDAGYWGEVEQYFNTHANLKFSHGLCPECILKYYAAADQCGPGSTEDKLAG